MNKDEIQQTKALIKLKCIKNIINILQELNLLEDEYKERVPKKIVEFFEEERDKEYSPIIDVNTPLDKQNLKRETMVLLAILNLNYWCDTEEEKREIIQSWTENEEREEAELREKYNPDNIFKKKEKAQEENNEMITNLIQYKEPSFIRKILDKIKRLFKR